MQLTPLLVCLLTMAPAIINAAPIPSNDLSLDTVDTTLLFPEGEPDLVKRVITPSKPAAKPVAKPVAAPAKPAPAPAKPAPAPAKPPAAKPPPAAPVKNPPKPPVTGGSPKPGLGTAPPAGTVDGCTGLSKREQPCKCFKKCSSCTQDARCGFNTVSFTCVEKTNGSFPPDTITTTVTGAKRCPATAQQGAVFPAIQNPKGVADIPAGLPTPQIQAAFTAIQPHVFTRESVARPDSGQHLKSVWIANHTGAKAVPTCNDATGLCTFVDGSQTGKTVWDDSTGVYSQQDVRNMCSVALALTAGARSNTEVNHVILTPLNVKICIQATKQSANFNAATGAGQGSCFPVGTAAVAANVNVHSAC